MAESEFWQQSVSRLLNRLSSSSAGLSSKEAQQLQERYGANIALAARPTPTWQRLARRFANPLVLVLLLASAISAMTGDFPSLAIVSSIVALSILLDFSQEARALHAVDALRAQVALAALVMRDGVEVSLPVAQLVPGDIVRLSAGDLVPADGALLVSRNFFVNQALLTGESYPVEKAARDNGSPAAAISQAENAVLAGTAVVAGSATMLVCATGRGTTLADIANLLGRKQPPTSFEVDLRHFSSLILRITLVLVLLVMTESLWFHRAWSDALIFSLALAVGLTPELLPMIMTITLARGAVHLARQKVIVKSLPAIHNLGAMDVLCTDKTGTLTEAAILLSRHLDVAGNESERVLELAWLNSHFESGLKSPLDDAILAHAKVDASIWRKLDELPFDFERRRVSVLLEGPSERMLIVKGAPEFVLSSCAWVEQPDGTRQPLTETGRSQLIAQFQDFSQQGYRLLSVASRSVGAQSTIGATDEGDLVFAGFAAFLDPPKASAAAALKGLCAAGISVKILTGDNEQVARHLCVELDFDPGTMITGSELEKLSDEALIGRLRETHLFCRVTPQQKLRVILALKRMGQTVGFLGDGINDAPALHAADVGISVNTATDVAKDAAEIVLLEKDLEVVHAGVMEGRRTIVNTGKYVLMASSANFGNIVSMVLVGVILPFLPLLPIQVLLTNLIYDFAQTAIPVDHVDAEAVAQPVHWDIHLIQRFMVFMGPVSTVFDVVTFGVMLRVMHADEVLFRTGWFVESLVTQILMVFAVRTRRHLFASRPHWLVAFLALGACGLTLALPFIPLLGSWFKFVPLPPIYFILLSAVVVVFLMTSELVKRLFYAHAESKR